MIKIDKVVKARINVLKETVNHQAWEGTTSDTIELVACLWDMLWGIIGRRIRRSAITYLKRHETS